MRRSSSSKRSSPSKTASVSIPSYSIPPILRPLRPPSFTSAVCNPSSCWSLRAPASFFLEYSLAIPWIARHKSKPTKHTSKIVLSKMYTSILFTFLSITLNQLRISGTERNLAFNYGLDSCTESLLE